MGQTEHYLVDSFTQEPGAGNPAGVVFTAGDMDGAAMQSMAGELGRESVFLSATEAPNQWRAAYYTDMARIPLCGHDTIAAIAVLAHTGRLSVHGRVRFLTDIGIVEGEMGKDGMAWMTQAQRVFGAEACSETIAHALNAPSDQIAGPCVVVSTGTPFLLVPLHKKAALHALAPDLDAVARLTKDAGAAGIFVWTQEGIEAPVFARCFAPGIGLPEDPVTGSASGALGAYLSARSYSLVFCRS